MFPQYLPSRGAYMYARASMWMAVKRSHRILTVSEASKRDIMHFFDVAPEKIVVVYNAIDERFRTAPSDEEVARVRERYQLDHGFVLYVGNIKPHKNLVRLIEAFDLLRRRGFEELKLLIIGDEISKLPALRRAVHTHKLHKHVRFLGYLPDETLAVLYRLAAVFVFPSLYEGFGLPPLEAMACGTPVVTSNVSSLPEVAGDAAVLVDPYDVESIVDGIERVLTDPALGAELRRQRASLARASSRGSGRWRGRGICIRRLEAGGSLTIALVHDWLTGMRGGERVLEVLCGSVSGRRHLHAVPPARIGVAGHRAPPHPHVVRAALAVCRHAVPAATCRSSRLRSSSSISTGTTW